MNARRGGFSLIEMLVSAGLFVALVVMGAGLFIRTTGFATESVLRSDLMEAAKIAQERIFDQLFSAKVISLGTVSGQPALVTVVPLEMTVGAGPKVDFFDTNGAINWGAVEPTGPKLDLPGAPHRLTITVSPTGTLSEKACGLDLNYDGDLLDTFQLGTLVLQSTAGAKLLCDVSRVVLSEVGKGAFDIDGDKVVDPLFQVTGEPYTDTSKNGVHDDTESYTDTNLNGRWDGVIQVNILTVARDRAGHGHRFVYKAGIKLLYN